MKGWNTEFGSSFENLWCKVSIISQFCVSEAEFILKHKRFYHFVACAFPFFEVMSVWPIDRYQNATPRALSLYELKKVQLQKHSCSWHSTGHLKMLCRSIYRSAVAFESEWKHYSSSLSVEKNATSSVWVWIQLNLTFMSSTFWKLLVSVSAMSLM